VLGHEFCGVVEEIGADVTTLKEGDFVSVDPNIHCGYCEFCRKGKIHLCENLLALGVDIDGGFAEYCLVPEKQCYKLHSGFSVIEASLLEPLSCAIYGCKLAEIKLGDSVAIVGAGIIGIMMLKLARLSGASEVYIIEINNERAVYASQMGADRVFNPLVEDSKRSIADITRGGTDVGIECVGSIPAFEETIKMVKRGGRVLIFGVTPVDEVVNILPYEIYKKNLTILGSFLNPFTFQIGIDLFTSGKINFKGLPASKYPLKDINNAFDNHIKGRSLKTIVDMSS
jgi:threonine dehydrogenase-like Zn-dependent dehydrogenase